MRLFAEEEAPREPFGPDFDGVFADRTREAEEFYRNRIPSTASDDDRRISRQAYAGLLWTKQFYHYVVKEWLEGDPAQPPPPASRRQGRNKDWGHLFNRDVISDARQVGVPLVCRLGLGLSHDPDGRDRSAFRQRAIDPLPARVVHAPQRATAGL